MDEDTSNSTWEKLHGRAIKSIEVHFNGNEVVFTDLVLFYQYMGDHADAWAVKYESGVEIARFNVRHIMNIQWASPL